MSRPAPAPGNEPDDWVWKAIVRHWPIFLACLGYLLTVVILTRWLMEVMERRRRRNRRRRTSAAAHGLKQQIPVVVCRPGEDFRLNGVVGPECSICIGELLDGERVRVLPNCNHSFHAFCIDGWLDSHSTCPNCRQSLLLDSQDCPV